MLGIAVVIFVGGAVALGLGGSTAPRPAPTTVRTAPGAPLPAVPAAAALRPIELAGQPPANIVDALALPRGARAVPGTAANFGVETYDRSEDLTVAASEQAVLTFFRAELRADGWQQVSSGPAHLGTGIEVLGQHAGSDGNTWEVGIVVHPTTFTGTGSAAATGTTPFSVELYIVSSAG